MGWGTLYEIRISLPINKVFLKCSCACWSIIHRLLMSGNIVVEDVRQRLSTIRPSAEGGGETETVPSGPLWRKRWDSGCLTSGPLWGSLLTAFWPVMPKLVGKLLIFGISLCSSLWPHFISISIVLTSFSIFFLLFFLSMACHLMMTARHCLAGSRDGGGMREEQGEKSHGLGSSQGFHVARSNLVLVVPVDCNEWNAESVFTLSLLWCLGV